MKLQYKDYGEVSKITVETKRKKRKKFFYEYIN
jgi:hypothetical protein